MPPEQLHGKMCPWQSSLNIPGRTLPAPGCGSLSHCNSQKSAVTPLWGQQEQGGARGAPRCPPPSMPREFSAQGCAWKIQGCLRVEGVLLPALPRGVNPGWAAGMAPGALQPQCQAPGAPGSHPGLLHPIPGSCQPGHGSFLGRAAPPGPARLPGTPRPQWGTHWPGGILAWLLDRWLGLFQGKTPGIPRARGWDGTVGAGRHLQAVCVPSQEGFHSQNSSSRPASLQSCRIHHFPIPDSSSHFSQHHQSPFPGWALGGSHSWPWLCLAGPAGAGATPECRCGWTFPARCLWWFFQGGFSRVVFFFPGWFFQGEPVAPGCPGWPGWALSSLQRTRNRLRRKFRVCCCPFTPPRAAHKPCRAGTEVFLGWDSGHCHLTHPGSVLDPGSISCWGPRWPRASWGQHWRALESPQNNMSRNSLEGEGLDWDLPWGSRNRSGVPAAPRSFEGISELPIPISCSPQEL